MEFRKVSDNTPVVDFIAKGIGKRLSDGQKVLWLAAGGSNISVVVSVSEQLKKLDLGGLTVTLTDERYGQVGHENSNWQQLQDEGFNLPGATLNPLLKGMGPQVTAEDFAKFLDVNIKSADYSVALMGIGADSHIAGIKPLSHATEAAALATYYEWTDFKRITMTFPAILKLDCVVAYLAGDNKRQAILKLQGNLNSNEYPSQVLKQAKQAIIFNDQLEGKL